MGRPHPDIKPPSCSGSSGPLSPTRAGRGPAQRRVADNPQSCRPRAAGSVGAIHVRRSFHSVWLSQGAKPRATLIATIEVEADPAGQSLPLGLTLHRAVLLETYDEADVVLPLTFGEAQALGECLVADAQAGRGQ